MKDLWHYKLNSDILDAIKGEDFLGTQHRNGSKITFIYGYSIKLMRFIIDSNYSECGEYTNVDNYGHCITLNINLKDVPKELLLELANLPHPKGWKHIGIIDDSTTRQLTSVGGSEYLFKDECNRFFVKS